MNEDKLKMELENFMFWYASDDTERQKISECIEQYIKEEYYK